MKTSLTKFVAALGIASALALTVTSVSFTTTAPVRKPRPIADGIRVAARSSPNCGHERGPASAPGPRSL
jgi:hypothetical protein